MLPFAFALCFALDAPPRPPNVVVILADDLGYGDVKCLNPQGKIATPHLDRLAAQGMAFTDAHSGSSVCTPTRYGLLTGRYCWRTPLQQHVIGGLSPRLIEPGRPTLAALAKARGRRTACVGKWHLGMDFALHPGKEVSKLSIEPREQVFNVDYSQPIKNGPNAVGFDEYFGIASSLDMVPYAFIRNDRLTAAPTEDRSLAMRPETPQRQTRLGPAAPGFTAAGVLPALTNAALEFLGERAAQPGTPFFLYMPLTSPHTPIAPAPEWAGKSGLGSYADFVMQTDDAVGQVLAALDRHGQAAHTLVIVTSDNGCSPEADFRDLQGKGHDPSAGFRGTKADIFEGGHRVPFLVRWPGVAKPGSVSTQLVCLTDIFRSAADAFGAEVPMNAGEDSFSFLPALRGEASPLARPALVHHSINGSFAIREGSWKLCFCPGSGGWSAPKPGNAPADAPPAQLFNLEADRAEATNVQARHPEVVARLTKLLDGYVANGRSTPGAAQANAVAVDFRRGTKAGPAAGKKKANAKKSRLTGPWPREPAPAQ